METTFGKIEELVTVEDAFRKFKELRESPSIGISEAERELALELDYRIGFTVNVTGIPFTEDVTVSPNVRGNDWVVAVRSPVRTDGEPIVRDYKKVVIAGVNWRDFCLEISGDNIEGGRANIPFWTIDSLEVTEPLEA